MPAPVTAFAERPRTTCSRPAGQRRRTEAIEILQAAITLKPTWRELHSNLGYACVQLGRKDEAVIHFRRALELDPNYAPSYTALADLLGRRGDRREARQLLRQAVKLNPSDTRAKALLDTLQTGPSTGRDKE